VEQRRLERFTLILLLLIATGVFGAGINWGLPGKDIDQFFFGNRKPWTGTEILQLLPPDTDERRGADVDATPLSPSTQPIILNATDPQRAEIVRRYRLFSYQPDEMITLMSLSKMKPSQGKFDPKLYQYGGLWIYPVGGLLKASDIAGIIRLESNQAFYLDHPAAFGKFYVVMRAYVVMWGLIGVWAIFWITRRLTSDLFTSFAATVCCIFMPVVVNMAHEAKPHLPGAVLMLLGIIAAVKYVEGGKTKLAILAGALCGGAFGMIISGATSFVILPAMVLFRREPIRRRIALVTASIAMGCLVYAITNPYVITHLVTDRSTLFSNLGNSTAMYQPSTSGSGLIDGFVRLSEGASLPLLLAGVGGAIWFSRRSNPLAWLLAVASLPVLIQFFLLAQNKPSEYARFALLPCICIGICGVVTLSHAAPRRVALWAIVIVMGVHAASYVWHFGRDSVERTSRIIAAERMQTRLVEGASSIHVPAEPAPYCLPPVDLFRSKIILGGDPRTDAYSVEIRPVDRSQTEYLGAGFHVWPRPRLLPTPISWASKPMRVQFWKDGRPFSPATQ